MSNNNDGSESVDQFLARIASVKEGRDEVNEERKRRMEDEFLKNRSERQARRLERARSISPSKTGPSRPMSTIAPPSSHETAINPPVDFSPRASTLSRSNAVRTSPTLKPEPIEDVTLASSPLDLQISPASSTTLSRKGTLSWQQRPQGRDGNFGRPRPFSTIETLRPMPKEDQAPPDSPKEQSKEEIAASLASKDASWFRQTQDRGAGSAAYRKNQVEDAPVIDSSMRSMRLPGLSTADRSESWTPTPIFQGPSQRSPAMGQSPREKSLDPVPSVDSPDRSSPNPLKTAIAIENPSTRDDQEKPSTDSFNTRSPSPTKGLGGFVQSAMLKRSDSVNKRWSVQANTGLRRGDSVAGTRPLGRSPAAQKAVSPPVLSPKPDFSQRKLDKAEDVEKGLERSETTFNEPQDGASTMKTSDLPRPVTPPARSELNRSPSKGLDSKRWSPTKSSWLESTLLSKQEPPKITPRREEQPQWMINLQRSKSIKDMSPERREPPAEEAQVLNQSLNRETLVSPSRDESIDVKPTSVDRSPIYAESSRAALPATDTKSTDPINGREVETLGEKSQPTEDETGTTLDKTTKKPPALKPKPRTPPKTDFRTTLRSRGAPADTSESTEPEFKSMFGRLKPATASNYVAPDTFKNNILSGKAGLAVTGGPQKSKRVDEFKESILMKKEAMKASADERKQSSPTKEQPKSDAPLPEALQRRKTLHKATPSITKLQDEVKAGDIQSQPKHKPAITQKPKQEKLTTSASLSTTRSQVQSSEPTRSEKPQADGDAPGALTNPVSGVVSQQQEDLVVENPRPLKPTAKPALSSKEPQKSIDDPKFSSISPAESKKGPQASPPEENSSAMSLTQGASKASNKLASRMNPNLAAILSRGNPSKGSTDNSSIRSGGSTDSLPAMNRSTLQSPVSEEQGATAGELMHMTKGRAKGPKRRAPKSSSESTTTKQAQGRGRAALDKLDNGADGVESAQQKAAPSPVKSPMRQQTDPVKATKIDTTKVKTPSESAPVSPTKSISDLKTIFGGTSTTAVLPTRPTPISKPVIKEIDAKQISGPTPVKSLSTPRTAATTTPPDLKAVDVAEEIQLATKTKPAVVTKSPELRKISSPQMLQASSKPDFEIAADKDKSVTTELSREPASKPLTPARIVQSPLSASTPISVTPIQTNTQPLTPSKSRVNTPKQPPTPAQLQPQSRTLPEKPISSKTIVTTQQSTGLGLGIQSKSMTQANITEKKMTAKKSDIVTDRTHNKATTDLTSLLNAYFPSTMVRPSSKDRAEFDTQALLSDSKQVNETKINTLSYSIWEVTTDGRKTALPSQQEHILYEESMYLMIHNYEAGTKGSGNTSEVFLWVGDGVPSAAVDDVQLFCKKDAREQNAKLEILRQGNEPASFFQALGGIIITRRSKSSALYVLCGRKHLGHITFDEVDFDLDSLCSGFPYLISARFGSLFLWKGKGSAIDEVGCARLIGMDLGLTGEIEEVDEGEEPESFWDAFSDPSRPARRQTNASKFWQMRNDHAAYPTSLYRVEHERPKSAGGFWGLRSTSPPKTATKASISLVSPYSQDDLRQGHVCVLDAYGAVYVLLDERNCSKTAECTTALHLAQEIAMLSPSIQGRSVLPSCHVVFGVPPADIRSCFRKWKLTATGSKGQEKPSACVRLEDVMQALAM